MSLNDVFMVGQVVYAVTVHTKDAGQVGTPSTVNAVISVEKPDGTLVNPAPTATVTMNTGVATVTWSTTVGTTTATAAGAWKFRVVTSGDLIDVYEGAFYVRASELV